MDRTPNGPSNAWLLQSPAGLALLLKKELASIGAIDKKQKLFIKRQRNHDLLFTGHLKNAFDMRKLGIAEAVMRCPVFGRYKVSQNQLTNLATVCKELGPRRLVVQVAGRVFDRRDLLRWLEKELTARGAELSHECEDELFMLCIDESYYFGFPMSKARESAGRDERVRERVGSLPAPIAAALAFSAQPKDSDTILDPVCGSGTLLAEVQRYAPNASRIGIDIDGEAIGIAKANLGSSTTLQLYEGDSRRLRTLLDEKTKPTLILANLPFGVQFGSREKNSELYRAIISEAYTQRGAEWRFVLLTSDLESLRQALAKLEMLKTQDLFRVKVRGELATAVLLTSTKTPSLSLQ